MVHPTRSYPQTPLILSLVFLSIFTLCYCAPQGYYYNRYYPYRPSGYSRAVATNTRRSYTPTNRVAAYNNYNRNYNSYVAPTTTATPTASTAITSDAYERYRRERSNYRVSKADSENAKFVGVNNQETEDEAGKTALLLAKKKLLGLRNRCSPFGRDVDSTQNTASTTAPKEQGRFLWDLNIYNVYPSSSVASGCGGLGGGFGGIGGLGGLGGLGGGLASLGGGLLSDPISPYYPQNTPFNNFLNLWAPGILQNALAATVPPPPLPPQADPNNNIFNNNNLLSDPAVDPNYRPAPPPPQFPPQPQYPPQPQFPIRRPNQVFFDSAGAGPVTPAQLVGGFATTVNGIIQQLTGNVQPVYNSPYG